MVAPYLFSITHIDIFFNSFLFNLLLGEFCSGEVYTATQLSGFKIFQKPDKQYIVKISTLENHKWTSSNSGAFMDLCLKVPPLLSVKGGEEGEEGNQMVLMFLDYTWDRKWMWSVQRIRVDFVRINCNCSTYLTLKVFSWRNAVLLKKYQASCSAVSPCTGIPRIPGQPAGALNALVCYLSIQKAMSDLFIQTKKKLLAENSHSFWAKVLPGN